MQSFIIYSEQIQDRFDPYYYSQQFKNNNILHDYPLKKLNELFLIKDGDHNKLPPEHLSTEIDGVRYLRAQDIKDGTIISEKPIFISKEYFAKIKRSHIKPGYLLISIMASIGGLAVSPEILGVYTANRAVGILIPKSNECIPEYVKVLFDTNYGKSLIGSIKKGGLQKRINLKDIGNLEIPLPPLDLQQRIASIMEIAYQEKQKKVKEAEELLDSVDEYVLNEIGIKMPQISNVLTFIVNSDELNKHRIDPYYYQPYFANLESSLLNIDVYKLTDLVSEVTGGATPDVTGDSYLEKDGIPFLRVQNVTKEGLNLNDVRYIKQEVHEGELKRSQLKKDDIVFTITGRIGSAAVVPDNFIGNINQHSVRLHLKSDIENKAILPEYVAIYFNTKFGNILSLRGVTGATRPALDYQAIKNLIIPLPSVEIQTKVIQEVKNRIEQVKLLNNEANVVVQEAKEKVESMLLATN